MIKGWVGSIALIAAAFALPQPSIAGYEVSPMRMTLVPSQGQRGASISVNNTDSQPLQVEIRILRRLVAEDGTQKFDPAEDDFTVFPPQVEILGGKSQSVRFQYIGPPINDISAAYVVQVAELPVATLGFSGVRFTYNFGVAVYLNPPRASEKMRLISAERHGDGIRLRIRNDGTRFGVASLKRILVETGGKNLELTPEMLGVRITNPLVAPRSERIFDIATPELADVAITSAVHAKLLDPNG